MFGYEINWTAVGICLTAIVAVIQLRDNQKQKKIDRELETKRDILLDGVRGMTQVTYAFGTLHNASVPLSETMQQFQAGMGQINVASSVGKLPTVKAGKAYADIAGPLFIKAAAMRTRFDFKVALDDDIGSHSQHQDLSKFVMKNALDLTKAMQRAIAAVRADVGIAEEGEDEFLAAVYPDEQLVRKAIDEAMAA